jgi:G3E family GTPase
MRDDVDDRRAVVLLTGLPGAGGPGAVERIGAKWTSLIVADDPDVIARELSDVRAGSSVLIDGRGTAEPLDLIDALNGEPVRELARLEGVVAAIDGQRLFSHFAYDAGGETEDGPATAELLVNQIELASALLLDDPQGPDIARTWDFVRALNPALRPAPDGGGPIAFRSDASRSDREWLRLPAPGSLVSGAITAFRYSARRPFQPERLADVLESGWAGVLRCKGLVWIATRGEERGAYVQAGPAWRLGPAGPWWASEPQSEWPDDPDLLGEIRACWDVRTGDRRQEMVFVGAQLDRAAITADLDSCLLTARESALGGRALTAMADPLPAWDDDAVPAAAAVQDPRRAIS